jgi:RNA polymerase sigma factor (sigma-70 family)
MAKPLVIDAGRHREKVTKRRDLLIEEHLPMVAPIARRLAELLPPIFEFDDLLQTGNLALVQAATRYRPAAHGGAPFSSYARQRIRGAMLDSVRKGTRRGRDRDVAIINQPIDEEYTPGVISEPEAACDRAAVRKRVLRAIADLPDAQRRVLTAYYGPTEPNLVQVGRLVEISAPKASRALREAILNLRTRLNPPPQLGDEAPPVAA